MVVRREALAGDHNSPRGVATHPPARPPASRASYPDLDGRVLRTLRALASPGRLTGDFLCGRRAPYLGPLKLLLLAGATLSITWALTRGVDVHYYGRPPAGPAAGAYIDTVVRGSFAACLAIGTASWVLAGRRRRLLDDAVFALHLVAALSLLAAAVIWLAAAWKLVWGTEAATPSGAPSLSHLFFLPAAAVGLSYVVGAVRRGHGGAWWAIALRALVLTAVGFATVMLVLHAGRPT